MSNVNQMFDEMLHGIAGVYMRSPEQRKLDAIISAYDACLAKQPDAGQVVMTTLLHATIEQARK